MKYSTFNPTPYETHMLVYNRIEPGSEVLDVGCATGYFAKKLKDKNCKVWGIDADEKALQIAKKHCDEVFLLDLDTYSLHPRGVPFDFAQGKLATLGVFLPIKKKFDYILLLDVVEHLKNPATILLLAKNSLKPNGKLIISTPNIAFISIRLALLFGKFKYTKMGIMDENHIHFFTKKTFLELIKECGLEAEELDVASGFSQITKIGRYLNYIPKYWQYKITKLFGTLLGYQFIAVCTK